jgi:hypothetical protein
MPAPGSRRQPTFSIFALRMTFHQHVVTANVPTYVSP